MLPGSVVNGFTSFPPQPQGFSKMQRPFDIKGKIISLLRATHTKDQGVGSREEVRKTHPTASESLDLQEFKSVNLPTIVRWGFYINK